MSRRYELVSHTKAEFFPLPTQPVDARLMCLYELVETTDNSPADDLWGAWRQEGDGFE
jgi:hypothetical protein